MSPATMRSAESPGLLGLSMVGAEEGFLTRTAAMDIVLTPQAFFRAAIGKARALPAWPEFIHQTVEVAYPQFAQAYTN